MTTLPQRLSFNSEDSNSTGLDSAAHLGYRPDPLWDGRKRLLSLYY
ncbi:MAG TPA: hypothetical protein V6D07_15315 [Trichocoleus sp.]